MTPPARITAAVVVLVLTGGRAALHPQVIRWRDAGGHEVERHCKAAQWPKKLPALDAILDSAALAASSDSFAFGDTPALVFSLLYQESSLPTVFLLAPDTLSQAAAASRIDALSRLLRPFSPPHPMGAVRVNLMAGIHATATIGRSVYCPPEVAGGTSGPRTLMVTRSPGDRLPSPGRSPRIDVKVSIDEEGGVTDVRLNAGSGIRDLDEALITELWKLRFLPALVDGLAIPSWMSTTGQALRL
jgi:TonB family protein